MLDHEYEAPGELIESLHTAIYVMDSETRQFSSEDRNTALDRTRDNTFDNRVKGASIQAVSRSELGGLAHRFVYGADYSVTDQRGVRNGTVPPLGETFPTRAFPNTDYTLAGVFAQDEITFADGRVVLYPAVRWDHYEIDPTPDALFVASPPASQSDSHVSPKLGVLGRVTDRFSVFANAAAGFKAPSPSEVNNGFANLIANYTSIANPDLKPETSRTLEAGVRWQDTGWSAGLTAFTGRYEDFIEQVQLGGTFAPNDPGIFQFVNLQNVRISGVEARGKATLPAGFAISAGAAYTRGRYDTDGVTTPLESIDPLKVVAGLDWRTSSDRLGAQLNATYSHGKEASRAGDLTCSPSCFLPGSFTALDVLGWWKMTDHLTLRGGLFNLTDEKYWWWGDVRGLAADSTAKDAYSQPGRNASVSVTLQF
jgi:hemoglobin/transferrin/lactoferrin receptor protein